MDDFHAFLRHPATKTFAGTAVGYAVIVTILAVLLFGLPILLFRIL